MARPVAPQSVALRLVTWLVGRTPLRVSYAIAWFVGQAVFLLWFGGRRRCIANMRRVSGGDRALARRYARRSFAYYGLYMVDFLRMGRLTAAEVRERVEYDGQKGKVTMTFRPSGLRALGADLVREEAAA